jgi:hypothetical protein
MSFVSCSLSVSQISVYGLVYDAASISDCIVSNSRMTGE